MNKKMSKRQKDIKSKLMAAICMLLVSSIMMVSTTYAWFTLSTAPEVTGITTAVGANGNLEMALMPLSGDTDDITSEVGDSMNVQDKTLANTTWGNLVELKDAYGLESITLYPSALNATTTETKDGEGKVTSTTTTIHSAFPVSIPEYGVDGRVTVLNDAKAMPGSWESGSYKDKVVVKTGEAATDDFMGVRAIGVASGATQAQLDYKAALVNASQAATNAQKNASGALVAKGGLLADIAVRHANNNDSYNNDDVANLQYMVDEVQESLEIVEDAIKEYVVAAYISKNSETYTEETVTSIRDAASLTKDLVNPYVGTSFDSMIDKLNGAIDDAEAADAKLATLTSGSYGWTNEIADVVSALADPQYMELNGFAINELEDHVGDLFDDVMAGKGINLYLKSNAGVFVDIADLCGDYSAPVVIPKIEHSSLPKPLENVSATMYTQSEIEPPYLTQARTTINTSYGAPGAASGEASLPLSDFYGYIIDLAFRTNVAGSNLQLQTAAVDRIYTDNTTNEATMGGGSTMVFKSADPNFTPARMIDLMKHLKVVLFDPTNNEVIKYLAITNVNTEIDTAADGTVTAPLYVANADGTLITRQKTDATGAGVTDEDGNAVMENDPTIMALDQNTIYQLSALVYLDGTNLTNADVANAAQSMAGSLNLQFSSSAELQPMEYADLRNGTVEAPTTPSTPAVTGTITPTVTVDQAVTDLTAASVSTVALTDSGFGFTVTGYNADNHVVAVTINGSTTVAATHAGNGAFACATTETVESVAINITAAPSDGG